MSDKFHWYPIKHGVKLDVTAAITSHIPSFALAVATICTQGASKSQNCTNGIIPFFFFLVVQYSVVSMGWCN